MELSKILPGSAKNTSGEAFSILIIIIWPFAFLWPYVLRFISIGNDFQYLYYLYKLYLISFLNEGHFPLWAPTEAAGFAFFSNPFVAASYPLNALYLLHYTLLGGLTAWDYSMYTIMGLSIYGVGLYLWLRNLSIASPIALATVMIAVVSLKLTEILRFPNAVHSAAWMPWLLLGIALATTRQRLAIGSVIFGVSSLMLLTAGYPYYIIYTVFLAGPYLLAMMFAPTRIAFLGSASDQPTGPLRLVLWIGAAFLVAAAVAFPWLSNVQVLMAQTVDRGVPDFNFASDLAFTLRDTVGSWVFPPTSLMEGWYYFGSATTLLIFSYLLCLGLGFGPSRDRRVVLMVIPWLVFVIYFTMGRDSVVFTWAWQHVPVLNQMRAWSRMNVVLIPGIALLLALALSHFVGVLQRARTAGKREPMMFVAVMGLLVVGLLIVEIYLLQNKLFSGYWERYFKTFLYTDFDASKWPFWILRNFDERYFVTMTAIAGGMLASMVLIARSNRHMSPVIALLAIVALSAIDLFPVSALQWSYPFVEERRVKFSSMSYVHDGLMLPRLLSAGTVDPIFKRQNVGMFYSWGFMRHAKFYLQFVDENGVPKPGTTAEDFAAIKRLYGADASPQRLFVSAHIDHLNPTEFLTDVDQTNTAVDPAIEIVSYDGDTLELTARTNGPCWLSFIDNWDPNWTASVNGETVPIKLLFGAYKSVSLPAGINKVIFSYRPGILGRYP